MSTTLRTDWIGGTGDSNLELWELVAVDHGNVDPREKNCTISTTTAPTSAPQPPSWPTRRRLVVVVVVVVVVAEWLIILKE